MILGLLLGGGLGVPGILILPPFFSPRQLWAPKWLPGRTGDPPGPVRASIFNDFDSILYVFGIYILYDFFIFFTFFFSVFEVAWYNFVPSHSGTYHF